MVEMNRLMNSYSTNFALAYSPDGKYVAVANNYGYIFIFSFPKVSKASTESKINTSIFSFRAIEGQIYSLVTKCNQLLCGTVSGEILAYSWDELRKQKPHLSFKINANGNAGSSAEVNALMDANNNDNHSSIFSAGGSGEIRQIDLETRKIQTIFTGHNDYVHCLSQAEHNSFLSGGEDGLVILWDPRAGTKPIQMMKPFENEECFRKNRGKWIGAISSAGDWIVCGGGPRLALWHLRSFSLAQVLESSDVDHHAVLFHDDKIIGCGGLNCMKHWNLKGEVLASVPVAPAMLYDLKFNMNSDRYKVLCTCGDGTNVDVFLNLGYSSFLFDTSF